MRTENLQSGFSAVELLVTLFIGFLFVTMGFQLYQVTLTANYEQSENMKWSFWDQLYLETMTDGDGVLQANYPNCPPSNPGYWNVYNWGTFQLSCPNPTELPKLRLLTVEYTDQKTNIKRVHARYFLYN